MTDQRLSPKRLRWLHEQGIPWADPDAYYAWQTATAEKGDWAVMPVAGAEPFRILGVLKDSGSNLRYLDHEHPGYLGVLAKYCKRVPPPDHALTDEFEPDYDSLDTRPEDLDALLEGNEDAQDYVHHLENMVRLQSELYLHIYMTHHVSQLRDADPAIRTAWEQGLREHQRRKR